MEEALLGWAATLAYAWLAAAATALVAGALTRNAWKGAGLGLMTLPLWRLALDVLPDLRQAVQAAVQGGVRHAERGTRELSDAVAGSIWFHVAPVVAGMLLWAIGHDRTLLRHPTIAGLAGAVRATGAPLGKGERASLMAGFALFAPLAAVNILLLAATAGLANSDEGGLWRNMTPYHVVLLALAAGVGEELVYRGVLQTLLTRLRPDALSWQLACIVLQATFFGLAHVGYANLQHLLFPTLFGLLAGAVAWRWGLWAAIVLHVLVDLFAFGLYVETTLMQATLGTLLLALCVTSLWVAGRWFAERRRNRRGRGPVRRHPLVERPG